MNITMPAGLVQRLKAEPNKSAFIAEAVREKLDRADEERRRRELARAYREASEADAKAIAEWDALAGDGL